MDEKELQEADALAKRLRLLIDAETASRGTEPTFTEISDFLAKRGIAISRGRWSYMINGHRYVNDPELLAGLAEYFQVDVAFLNGEDGAGLPEQVAAQLDLVRSMRAAKVKSFAARTLGDISPEALRAITRFLDEDAAKR